MFHTGPLNPFIESERKIHFNVMYIHSFASNLQAKYGLSGFILIYFSPSARSSAKLFPLMLCVCCHFWAALWGVCVCVCEFFLYECMCGFERAHVSNPICMEMKWNDQSRFLNGHCNSRFWWVFMLCCWSFDFAFLAWWEFAQLSSLLPSLKIS